MKITNVFHAMFSSGLWSLNSGPHLKKILILLFAATTASTLASALDTGEEEENRRWNRFQPSFDAFAEADLQSPFKPGGILFLGSSIFRQWSNVADMMAPMPVLNRAFGGSRTGDQLARFDDLVPRYLPSVIVYYCGSNDLKAGHDPEDIFGRFETFSKKARAVQPDIRIIYVSSMRSPDRLERWDQVDRYNHLVETFCNQIPGHYFIDINPSLLNTDGRPRPELFRADQLHLTPLAYEEFTNIVKPILEEVWSNPGQK